MYGKVVEGCLGGNIVYLFATAARMVENGAAGRDIAKIGADMAKLCYRSVLLAGMRAGRADVGTRDLYRRYGIFKPAAWQTGMDVRFDVAVFKNRRGVLCGKRHKVVP